MNAKYRKLAVLLTLFSVAVLAVPALANPGLGVAGAKWVADVVPGSDYTHKIAIGTEEVDPAMDVMVDVRGLGQSPQGAIQALEASEDSSPYSARSFITVDKSLLHLEPGEPQEVVATLHVPEDVTAGGRYAVIYVHTRPMGEGQVGIITAVNIPVYLTVKDSQLLYEGKITGLPTAGVVAGEPIAILTSFQNTGNYHYNVKGEVTVKDSQGKVLDKISIPVSPFPLFPSLTRQLEATFSPQGELPLGSYSVQSKVMLEDGTVLDEASGSFEVKEAYAPPAPPASITLTPGSPATLETADGRISIAFPQGSVTGQVEVSMQSCSPAQLPVPQSGLKLGTTSFRIDGLTGLLVKEATITVKYTSADLDKAEGDASKLSLARWDEAQSAWSVLSTRVDAEAMTLSAETNQLSTWAVMVGPAPPAPSAPVQMNLMLIIGGAAAVIIIILLVYFLAIRRRSAY